MNDPMQQCPRCTETLPLGAYPTRHRGKPGNYCTDCRRAYMREYRRANPRAYQPKPVHTCTAQECETRVLGTRELCAQHTPRPSTPPRPASTTYRAVHKRISTARGKAAGHTCFPLTKKSFGDTLFSS